MASAARSIPPFSSPTAAGDPRAGRAARTATGPTRPPSPISGPSDLTTGRRLRTRTAGVFLFLPLLAQVRLDQLVVAAGYPGSEMVPAARRDPGPADAEAPRQGAAQPHRRLQLRRGPRPLRRAEHPPQEVLRHRLLVSDHPREPTRVAPRLGAGAGRRCCSPRPTPSRWTSIPSPTGATRPGSISTTCRSAARPARASRPSSPWSRRAVACAMPTPT